MTNLSTYGHLWQLDGIHPQLQKFVIHNCDVRQSYFYATKSPLSTFFFLWTSISVLMGKNVVYMVRL